MRAILCSRRLGGAAAAAALAAAVLAALIASSIAPAAGDLPRVPQRINTARVNIKDFAFRPATLRIARGTRVVFANGDRAAHTATRRGSFDSGRIRGGQAAAVRFGSRGTFSYHCKIHPFMRGKVVVQ